jgi:hypothetical protein
MFHMWLLMCTGLGLIWYGYRVAVRQVYPNGRPDGGKWPLRHILMTIPRWEMERVLMLFGGYALQFAGYLIVISALFR